MWTQLYTRSEDEGKFKLKLKLWVEISESREHIQIRRKIIP
jgi:hypothetical protein